MTEIRRATYFEMDELLNYQQLFPIQQVPILAIPELPQIPPIPTTNPSSSPSMTHSMDSSLPTLPSHFSFTDFPSIHIPNLPPISCSDSPSIPPTIPSVSTPSYSETATLSQSVVAVSSIPPTIPSNATVSPPKTAEPLVDVP